MGEIPEVTRKTLFIILINIVFVILTRIVIAFPDPELLFLMPFGIIPRVICTFYDANQSEINGIFKKRILNIHHIRTLYPERDFRGS